MLLGTDLEFGLFSQKSGKWLPPFGSHMEELQRDFDIKADGTNYELCVPPQKELKDLISATSQMLIKIGVATNCLVSLLPIQDIDLEKVIHRPEVRVFGCMPDISLTGEVDVDLEEFKKKASELEQRPAGGHIHISHPKLFISDNKEWLRFQKLFNKFQEQTDDEGIVALGKELQDFGRAWEEFQKIGVVLAAKILELSYNSSLLLHDYLYPSVDKETIVKMEAERRKLYGQALKVRPKTYRDSRGRILQGVEIRAPSPTLFVLGASSPILRRKQGELLNIINRKLYDISRSYERALEYLEGFPDTHKEDNDTFYKPSIFFGYREQNVKPVEPLFVVGSKKVNPSRTSEEDLTYEIIMRRFKADERSV